MGGNNAHELALLDQAGQALAEAQSFEEIKTIRDKAEAVRKYAQSASLGLDVQNRAAEVKLRAERQAGKLLAQLTLRGGDRRSKNRNERLKLDDLGITPNQSTRWQLQARVPDTIFRDHIKQTCESGQELTSAGLMRLAKRWRHSGSDGAAANGFRANGHGSNGHLLNGSHPTGRRSSQRDMSTNGKRLKARRSVVDESIAANEPAEIVSELRNHYSVLDGILRPLYSGETKSLLPAECRVLRYLLSETQTLLADLDGLQQRAAACACHQDRVA